MAAGRLLYRRAVKGLGLGETLGSPWIPLEIRPFLEHTKLKTQSSIFCFATSLFSSSHLLVFPPMLIHIYILLLPQG
jgi:hypothetical protein